ncbi:hypothetical protein [Flindersiella endophytica]
MSTYTVTRVRKERSEDCSHRHLEGVITDSGRHYTRRQVVESIRAGDQWRTNGAGPSATIHALAYCPRGTCLATPYLATCSGGGELDNLEDLPEG